MVSNGQRLVEDFRRERRAGDPRVSAEGRTILQRITSGDLVEEFAESLESGADEDPGLSSPGAQ